MRRFRPLVLAAAFRPLLVAAAVVVLLSSTADSVLAAQIAKLEVSLSPEHLGQPTTVHFGFRLSNPAGSPVPLTNVGVLLPHEMGLATSGLGLENCLPLSLNERGPAGCPANSLMGRGIATAQVPIGSETVSESAQIEIFSAPVMDGHLSMLVYANAMWPVSAQLVFPARILPALPPYSENVDTAVPLVPSLPGGPDVAVTRLHASLGTARGTRRFVYHKLVRGRRVSYSPRGLVLPPSCPRGGFTFMAEFSFQDLTHTTARVTVPCPPRSSRPSPA